MFGLENMITKAVKRAFDTEQVPKLKAEIEELKLQKKMEEREIEHLVKLKEEKLDIEHQKKELTLKDEFKDKEMKLQTDYHDKTIKQLDDAKKDMGLMYKEIMKRLPNVSARLEVK